MTDDRLKEVLRGALASSDPDGPTSDLWARVATRCNEPQRWSYVDLGLAAALGAVLALVPEWIWLLAYHL